VTFCVNSLVDGEFSGLKPKSFAMLSGTAEAVPFPPRQYILGETAHVRSRTKLLVNGHEMGHNQGGAGEQAN
jgi:hypothetical protein